VAEADTVQTGLALVGDEVVLDASSSSDPDGSIVAYRWKQTQGFPVALSDPTATSPTFMVPDEILENTLLTFDLTVTDDKELRGMATMQVEVSPAAAVDPAPNPEPASGSDNEASSGSSGSSGSGCFISSIFH
jgi:hypothetical protein